MTKTPRAAAIAPPKKFANVKSEAPFSVPGWPEMPRLRKLTDAIPYEHNARTHPPAQISLLAELLKKYGPDQPIVIDEKGIILKGHGRRLGAAEAGFEHYPMVQRFGLSEDDKRAMRIADNQVALLAGWDDSLVKFEVQLLERNGFEMKLLGFGDKQLVQFTTQLQPPSSFQTYDESIPVDHQCPRCGYVGSGDWSAKKPEEKPQAAAAKEQKAKKNSAK